MPSLETTLEFSLWMKREKRENNVPVPHPPLGVQLNRGHRPIRLLGRLVCFRSFVQNVDGRRTIVFTLGPRVIHRQIASFPNPFPIHEEERKEEFGSKETFHRRS